MHRRIPYDVWRPCVAAKIGMRINAIDAAPVLCEDGTMWLAFGSWFAGIWMLRLDPATGLRDRSIRYPLIRDTTGNACQCTLDSIRTPVRPVSLCGVSPSAIAGFPCMSTKGPSGERNGWLAVSPALYRGEPMQPVDMADIPGDYDIIIHDPTTCFTGDTDDTGRREGVGPHGRCR